MKVIHNYLIPFKGYYAINLFGVVFARKDRTLGTPLSPTVMNHEAIHTAQMREMLYVFFYIWYFFEWVVRMFLHKFNWKEAYFAISLEREAYYHQWDEYYLRDRKHYAWLRHLKGWHPR